MSEEIFELERPFERTELAALFQGFASALTDGQPLTVETEDGVVSMDVPERVSAELELELEMEEEEEEEQGEEEAEEEGEEGNDENHGPPTVEFEIELEWEDSSGTSIRTDELVGETGADETSDEVTEDVATEATGEEGDEPVEDGADRSSVTDQRRSRFEVYRDEAGEWRWRLVHWNGNIIADSGEGYTTRRSAVNGLESVRHNAPGATVDHRDRT